MYSLFKIVFFGSIIILFELFILDFITINNIRPDFLLIYVLYISLIYGRLKGLLSGFLLGILEDFISGTLFFGLSALTKTISGFLFGNLSGKFRKINPIFYFGYVLCVIGFNFFIYFYVSNQNVFTNQKGLFFNIYFYAFFYTLIFFFIINYIKPINSINYLKDR